VPSYTIMMGTGTTLPLLCYTSVSLVLVCQVMD